MSLGWFDLGFGGNWSNAICVDVLRLGMCRVCQSRPLHDTPYVRYSCRKSFDSRDLGRGGFSGYSYIHY
jgi:hypothetical protein